MPTPFSDPLADKFRDFRLECQREAVRLRGAGAPERLLGMCCQIEDLIAGDLADEREELRAARERDDAAEHSLHLREAA